MTPRLSPPAAARPRTAHVRTAGAMSASALPIVAAMLLVGGFADLAHGGAGLAASLLSAAYCVAIPAAIVAGTSFTRRG